MKRKQFVAVLISFVMLLSACNSGGAQENAAHFSVPSFSSTHASRRPTESTPPSDTMSSDTEPSASHSDITITRSSRSTQVELFPEAPVFEINDHEKFEYQYQQVTIDEQEIWNKDGLILTACDFAVDGREAYSFSVRIDNQTDSEVELTTLNIYQDGYYTGVLTYTTVPPKTTSDAVVFCYPDLGDMMNVWQPHLIEVSFDVEMSAEGVVTSYKTPLLPIQTSLYGQEFQMELSYATDIYRDESLNIQALDYYEEDGNATLVLNVENLSNMVLDFESSGSWFDGKDVGYAGRKLAPGCKSIVKLTVYKEKRIEYGIEAPIHDIVLQLCYTLDRQDEIDIDPIRLTVG